MSRRYVYKKKRYILIFSIIDFFGFLLNKLFFFFKKSISNIPIKKIVVIELAHIGDVLAITPALHILRKKFPQSLITVAVSPWAQEVITGNPDIDEILVYNASWFNRNKKSYWSLTKAVAFIKLLRAKKFDMGIDLRGDVRTILLMRLSGIKKRVGYGFTGGAFMLTDIMPFDVGQRQNKHQIEHNIDFITSIGEGLPYHERDMSLKIFFSDKDILYVDKLLKDNNTTNKDFLIAIHPGAGIATKRWPAGRFSLLINEILKEYKVKIILVGGEEDDLLKLPGLGPSLINLTGKTNLKQLAALLKKCNLFIGGDSGVMHIASAVGIPIVAIWGGQNKPSHWKPLLDTAIVVHKEVDCSPCGLITCKDLKCLNDISIEDVFVAVAKQLNKLLK